MKVVTFGELLLRLSAPGYSKIMQNNEFLASFCGSEANVAVSLANYGIDVSFVSRLPYSIISDSAIRTLKYYNVDTSNIILGNGRFGLYYLEKGASQRASKIEYDREYSAFYYSKINDYNWNNIFSNVSWFHISGIDLALSEDLVEICEEACKIAKEKGITISFDINYRAKLWRNRNPIDATSRIMKYVDVCIGNEEDAVLSLGIVNNCNDYSKITQNNYIKYAKEINKKFKCKIIVFTLRESLSASINNWSSIAYDGNAYFSKKYEIQLVDRVGAGDSFVGGLIYSLLMKKDLSYAIEFATAASCLKQTIENDFNLVTIDEVEYLMKTNGTGRIQR